MARKAYLPRSPKPLTPAGPRRQAEAWVTGPATAFPEAQEALPPGVANNLALELRAQQADLDRQKEELRQAQLELERNRARYFDLYDLAPVGYCTLSEEGLILESNQMAAKLLGGDRHTLFKQPFSNHIVPEEVDNYHLRRRQILDSGEAQTWDLQMVCGDRASAEAASPFWANLTATLAKDAEGGNVLMVIISNISVRKQAETKLRVDQERLKTILDTVGDPIFVKDSNHRIILANRAFYDVFHLDEHAVIGNTLEASLPADEMKLFLEVDQRVLDSGIPEVCEETLTINGTSRSVITTMAGFIDHSGTRFLVGAIHDITDRKRTEAALRTMYTVVEQCPITVIITDPAGFIQYVNPKFTQMTGYTPTEVIGQIPSYLKTGVLPPEVYTDLLDTLRSGGTWHGVFYNKKKNGEVFWEEATVSPIKDAQGTLTHFVALKEDITDQRKAEIALQESNDLLAQFISQSPFFSFIKEVTPDGSRFIQVSDNFEQFRGRRSSDVIGRTTGELFPVEIAKRLTAEDWAVASSGKSMIIEEQINGRSFSIFKFPIQQGERTLVAGCAIDVTEQELSKRHLADSHEQLRTLLTRLQRVQEEERIRLSREIHDELGQLLTGLKMDVRWLERKLSEPGLPPALNPLLDRVVGTSELADAMLATVQRIAAELRPSTLDRLGLEAALYREAHRFQARSGIPCTVTLTDPFPALNPELANDLFYICREALTNVGRHAQASQVEIGWRIESDQAVLTICDNGVGMGSVDHTSLHSLGLTGMRERALHYGGTITFEANKPRGTLVVVRMPCPPPAKEGKP